MQNSDKLGCNLRTVRERWVLWRNAGWKGRWQHGWGEIGTVYKKIWWKAVRLKTMIGWIGKAGLVVAAG